MGTTSSTVFLCPRDDSQGALRFAPVYPSVCLSVRPFVTFYGIEFVHTCCGYIEDVHVNFCR